MTDINKAMNFASVCLGWGSPRVCSSHHIEDSDCITKHFDIRDCGTVLDQFLGQRFFIQINRGSSSLFKWSVIVGLQNRVTRTPVHEHGRGEGDDMLGAIFDACVAAIRLYPPTAVVSD